MANLTEPAAPPRSNNEAVAAFVLALAGFAIPLFFPAALVLGRTAMRQAFSGAPHRGLSVAAYGIGWIGTGFFGLLILVIVIGGAFGVVFG